MLSSCALFEKITINIGMLEGAGSCSGMNGFDIAGLCLVSISALIGSRVGAIKAVMLFIGLGVGVYFAGLYSQTLSTELRFIDNQNFSYLAAFALIFVSIMILASLVGSVIRKTLSILMLGWVDKFGGLVLGALVGIGLFFGIASLLVNFPITGVSDLVGESVFAKEVTLTYEDVSSMLSFVPEWFSDSFKTFH